MELAAHVLCGLQSLPAKPLTILADVLANYVVGAGLGLITWWLESGQPYPAERMVAMTQELILKGVLETMEQDFKA